MISNPYVWGEGANTIPGPVMKIIFEDTNHNAMKSMTAVEVTFKHIGHVEYKSVNISHYIDDSGMTFHKVNVMSASSALIVQLVPPDVADVYEIYFKRTYSPTTGDFDYMGIFEKMGNISVVIIPEEIITIAGMYYIGLKQKHGRNFIQK